MKTAPDPHGQPIFNAKVPRLIYQPGARTDKTVPDKVERLQINPLSYSRLNTSHGRPRYGLGTGPIGHTGEIP